jgi:hypothetical protein
MKRPLRISPTTAVALVALFFALGGSAFALGTKIAPQPRCAQGAVRGIVEVTGQPGKGVGNVPDQYTSDGSFFGKRFNCTGGTIEVRRSTAGTYDVRFVGNPATSAVSSTMGPDPSAATAEHMADGSFHVTIGSHSETKDVPFTVVLL